MVTHLYGILGVILDRTFGNIIRMLRVIRLPKEERGHLSWTFVGTLAVILAYGLIMMFSASYSSGYTNHGGNIYYFIKPQAIVAAVGFVVMLGVSLINYRALRYMFWTFYVITLALLVLALFMPSDNNGCYRWVYLPGGMSLQPSELAKFAVILGTADILDHHQREIKSLFQCVFKPACLLIPILVLLKLEPHNSAMLLMAMIFATMLVCAGAGGVKLWAVAVPAGVAVLAYFIKSLASGDDAAAKSAVEMTRSMDQMERDIENRCLRLLLQQQPVARDLRTISAAMKMVTDLQRIGDQCANIAEISLLLKEQKQTRTLADIRTMSQKAGVMVKRSIFAYVNRDTEAAQAVIALDDEVDALFRTIKGELVELIAGNRDEADQAIDLIIIAKYLERIADHAVNIAQWAIFCVTGEILG